jgi:transposase
VYQSGSRDHRGPLSKNGPRYLRWALLEAATHAARHPVYRDHYEATKRRLGRQRGAKVARVEVARKLAEAIWHRLTTQAPFRPARPTHTLWPYDGPRLRWASRTLRSDLILPPRER